ncbi:hypothetical protein BKA70DRAFT_1272858 [Coprinopsis sp. MPI-PUGE-AT-0042]|nr:hypothetical protein BKA70DRAFT_1272858 [Coprinopsis sp. MPI-PUGE-AT-0042]
MSDVPSQMPREEENLFTVLKKSSIRLTEIQSGGICKPLLQYLLSYRDTLQTLTLNVSRSPSNQVLAVDLDTALLNHQTSLCELSISAKLDEGWALGENNKDMLLVPLPALESLRIPVYLGSDGSYEGEDYLRICLDRAVDPTRFPILRRVHVDYMIDARTALDLSGGPRCGNAILAFARRRHDEALRRLQSYHFTISDTGGAAFARPPVLHIAHQDIPATHDEMGWRYVPQDRGRANLPAKASPVGNINGRTADQQALDESIAWLRMALLDLQ